jgi:hypothetical protein
MSKQVSKVDWSPAGSWIAGRATAALEVLPRTLGPVGENTTSAYAKLVELADSVIFATYLFHIAVVAHTEPTTMKTPYVAKLEATVRNTSSTHMDLALVEMKGTTHFYRNPQPPGPVSLQTVSL